ncbi:MAG: cache domain-containing protein [Desulfobacteraceae bacterium]|nr:cache domain-containing protein [Desulfobacteraceae bacterium]
MLVTILIIAPTIGSFWIFSEYHKQKDELVKIREQHTALYKTRLQDDINNTISFIEYKKSSTEERVKALVREKIQDAYALASHIYGTDKNTVPEDVLKSRIIETLRTMKWDNGKGYFFIFDHKGATVLNADIPEMEGHDMLDMKDMEGNFVVRDILALARKQDLGFYPYRWSKPGALGIDHLKIICVKNFEPFDWAICAGFYVEDMEETIKGEILDRISQPSADKDRYTFILEKDGFCLSHPLDRFHRKNVIRETTPEIGAVYRELIDIGVKNGMAYVEYPVEKPSTGVIATKLTYAVFLKDFEWIMGTGVYLDDIEKIIEMEKSAFNAELKRNILIILWFSFLLAILSLIFGFFITNRLYQGMNLFTDFFRKAAVSDIKINESLLIFNEFKLLGKLANQMVEDRMVKEEKLKKAMQETVTVQNMLKNITDSMPSALIAIDQDMKILQWNKKIEKTTGISARAAEGRLLTDLLPFTSEETEMIEKTFRDSIPYTQTRVMETPEKEKRYEDITVYPLVTHTAKGAVIRIDDTTEKIRIEEMIIQSEKMMSVGGLAAGMAHEINNPLSGIIGNTDVLKNRLLTNLPANETAAADTGIRFSDIKAYAARRDLPLILDNIRQAAGRAAGIVSDMLSFSRMSSSAFSWADLAELLDKTIDLASAGHDPKNKINFKTIKITRVYEKDMPPVLCDGSKLQQVFLNILSNGAQAMSETDRPPEFTVNLSRVGAQAVIRIEDTGPGIPDGIRKRIFEPFFTTKEIGVGTGLGLSVSYFIITNHHKGSLEVESEPGKGAAFIIRIPVEPA